MELKGFKKLNESVSPELLNPDELSVSENLVLDEEIGRPKKRFGWARYNSNAVAGAIASLHEVQVTSGGTDYNYLLAGHSGKLQKSLDGTGTWEDVTSLGTPPYKMQAYADEFIFTDGSVPPFVVTDIENSTESVYNLEIEKPDISDIVCGVEDSAEMDAVLQEYEVRQIPILGDALTEAQYNIVGRLKHNVFYKWLIVYITDTGQTSPPSTPFTLSINEQQNVSAYVRKHAAFNNLPVSTDTRVTKKMIYRTIADGDVFYFHSIIDNSLTSWADYTDDSSLGSEGLDYLNIPQTAKYITLHKERIILGNITRAIKSYVDPAYCKATPTSFTALKEGVTKTFTNDYYYYSPITVTLINNNIKGIGDCYALASGGSLSGDYTFKFIYYDAEGLISDVITSNTVTVGGGNNTVRIPSMPTVVSGYDLVKKAEVYADKNGAGYKLLMEYDPHRSATNNILYPTGYEVKVDAVGGDIPTYQVDTEKCGVAFSEIGQPATFVLEDIRNIFPDDGDEITGVYDDQDGILIFKLKSICKIFTNGSPDNWRLVKVLPNIGCDEPNSLIKYGNTYAFSFQNSIYTWNSQGGLEEIGVEIWDTLSQVTAYHCATADSGWFIFGVSGAGLTTGYGFLIYDYNMKSWYKFTTTTIPYVAKIKENGDDIGTILTSNATYILNYSEDATDSDTGTAVQITPKLRTKTFGESIALQRLRKIKFNYLKLSGQDVTITIVNPDSSVTNTYTDNTGSGWKLYESPVKDTDLLKETSKFYINITGAGLVEFGTLRVEAKPILRGKRDAGQS